MKLSEFMGIKNANTDIETGVRMEHRAIYRRCIERLGGLEAVKPYIPFTIEQIVKAVAKDENLNNLPLDKWDVASGFKWKWTPNGDVGGFIGGGIWSLYKKFGIDSASNAQGVCILKEAAREWAEESEGGFAR